MPATVKVKSISPEVMTALSSVEWDYESCCKRYAVEIQSKYAHDLGAHADRFEIGDFLEMSAVGGCSNFDCILMNPPFTRQQDIDHVLHAWQFLKPGGRLVSIMSPGWYFRTNRKSVEFKEFVETHGTWHENDEGAFKESGTNIKTVTVVLDK